MRIALFFVLFTSFLHAKTYYAKVEPYEIRNISANVAGLVEFVDEDMLGKKLSNKPYLRLDSEIDGKDLTYTKAKIESVTKMLETNEAVLKNLEASLEKKRQNYKRIESLKIKSVVEKDREFHDLINSENQYLSTQKEVENLKVQLSDLKLREAQLTRNLKDKSLKAKGFVLYSLEVVPGQVVNFSTPLARIADVSKAKLIIFLDSEDMENVEKKVVYIDGKKTSYKVSRVQRIADSKNISKYTAQIIMKSPKVFSKLVKVELKDK